MVIQGFPQDITIHAPIVYQILQTRCHTEIYKVINYL